MRYDFASIERKWQQYWSDQATFRTPNPGDPAFDPHKPKFYVLDMFPYPSGVGLHVGHPLGYIATDIIARYRRMTGYNVLHPMGYDAFGLPAEQFAVEHGVHPRVTTQQNIANMTRQLKRLGLSYDWDRCLATTEPEYYRWTQWVFLQMFNSWFDPAAGKARPIAELEQMLASEQMYVAADGSLLEASAKGLDALFGTPPGAFKWHELQPRQQQEILDRHRLAYMAEVPVNWCPALGTVLANEEVTNDGRSERGNFPVFRRPLRQWMLRITAYADRLLADLDTVDWPEPIKLMQRNWIGRSEGARVDFPLAAPDGPDNGPTITVFTTRPDTLFGATYLVLAPEHPLVDALTTPDQLHAVQTYQARAASKSDLERSADAAGRAKTGVFTGAYAINPVNNERIPIWIADYVMMGYGTGAIMAVPAHDQRDFDFAKQFHLPIRDVVYTPVLAAIAGFARHYDPAPLAGMDEAEALADYVGLCITHPQMGSDEAWNMVSQRRRRLATTAEELRNLVSDGRERRGTIAAIWRETLQPYIGTDIHRLLAAAREGRLIDLLGAAVEEPGINVHSANNEVSLNGMRTEQAKKAITHWLTQRGLGSATVQYKLRDWLFSRQRYWGEPFPVLHGPQGQIRAVDESHLPVLLPELDDFRPAASDDPEAPPQPPLSRAPDSWKYVDIDGVRFTREFNTMPQWAGSCWYYLRFCDPHNDRRFVAPAAEKYWMSPGARGPASAAGGVDLYVGGAEHAVLHLLYARFWHKVLFDLGHVSTPEPFGKLFNQGYIQAHAYVDARGIYVPAAEVEEKAGKFFYKGQEVRQEFGKMGKSLKNAVTPDEICDQYGCDTLRLYEMYLGPLDQNKVWRTRDITGVHRFLQRFWRNLVDEDTGRLRLTDEQAPLELRRKLHKTIKRVTDAMDTFCFNVGIAALIELNNDLVGRDAVEREIAEAMILCLSPMAPHIAEELWEKLGHKESLAYAPWPKFDPALLVEEQVEYPVQVNGRLRSRITVPSDADDAAVEKAALADPKVALAVEGKLVTKVIVVRSKMVNIVAK